MDLSQSLSEAIHAYRTLHQRTTLPELRAVLFDMDGVLFDSMPAHCRSWVQAAHEVGLEMSPEDVYWFEGQTGSYTIDLLYERTHHRRATLEERQHLYQRKTELFVRYDQGQMLPDVTLVLEEVRELQRLVVTGSSQASLLNRLEEAFPGTFALEQMVTGRDVQHGKPHPEPYLMGLEKAGVQPTEALVVENAPMGVRSASSAGIFTIAVNTGLLPDTALWEEGASLVFPSMTELARALPTLRSLWTKA